MKLLKDLSGQAKSAYDAVEGVVGDTGKELESTVASYSQSANQAAGQAQDAFSAAGEEANEIAEQISSFADEAEQAINDADSDVGQAIDDIASRAKAAINDAASAAGKAGEQLAEWGNNAIDRLVTAAKTAIGKVQSQIKSKISLAKSVIANEFQLARSRAEGAVANVANVLKAVYVNAGWWGGDATDFVLVSGCYVVQCSWLGDGVHRCELKPGDDEDDRQAAEAILRFLEEGRGRGGANPTMLSIDEALIPLTDDLMVFLGDMHIHIFKGSPFDTFTTGLGSEKRSLITDLREFLEHAANQGVTVENIIQVGDCLDVWVAQVFMDVLCDLYVLAAGVTPTGLANELGPIFDKCKFVKDVWKPLTDNIDTVGNQEAAIRADFLSRASPKAVAEIIIGTDYARTLPNVPSLMNPLDFTDANAVEEAVKDVYDDVWDLFTRVPGNHDNNVPNDYLQAKYGRSSGLNSKDDPYLPLERGRNDCIAIEHGDACDRTNRRDVYDKPNRGFLLTRYFTVKQWVDAAKSDWGALLWGGSIGQGAAASVAGSDDPSLKILQQFARARAFDLRTQNAANLQGRVYRLIVLGHSHLAEMSSDRPLEEAEELAMGGALGATLPGITETAADYLGKLPTI